MTQHHDPVHPDSGDLGPDPDLAVADEAYVCDLLASLPAVTMPREVAARIDDALADLGPVASPAEPLATPTVVPLVRRGSPRAWRNPRVLQVAAVMVLVVAGGVVGVKAFAGRTTSTASTASAVAGAAQQKTAISQSNRAYTTATLVSDVHSLVGGRATAYGVAGSGATPVAPSPATSGSSSGVAPGQAAAATPPGPLNQGLRRLTASAAALAPCIAAIEEGLAGYVDPVAIDAGTFNGRPALVVVLPGAGDPSAYDVWIVGPTCGTNKDADLIRYQAVPRG